jgi:cardiolipin synthase
MDLLATIVAYLPHIALVLVTLLDVVFVLVILLLERDDPTRTLQWLMALLFLPIAGVILYLLFHQNHAIKRERFEAKARADLGISTSKEPLLLPQGSVVSATDGALAGYGDLALLVSRSNPQEALATRGNDVRLFIDGKEKFRALLDDLRTAKEDVHLEYYIMRDDALSRSILEILEERAREGVEVRLLLDAFGGLAVRDSVGRLAATGVKVAFFYPGVSRINYRDHRKIAVIDGRIGYCGGYNIGEEYLGNGPLGYWRDAAVRVAGPGANRLQLRFLRDWLYASRERIEEPFKYFNRAAGGGSAVVQEVSSGPDTLRPWVEDTYLKMISMARESCYIQTPYFAPGTGLSEMLRVAANSGVDVRIMIPNKPDHPFVFWASQSFCADLLASGVHCYEYGGGFLHAKTIVVDGKVGSVGTANFDHRSFVLNFETNVVIYDPEIAAAMRKAFLDDLARCTELTPEAYARRSLLVKLKEPVSRLFYPVA